MLEKFKFNASRFPELLKFSPFWIYITEEGNIKLGHFRTEKEEIYMERARIVFFH